MCSEIMGEMEEEDIQHSFLSISFETWHYTALESHKNP